MSRKGFIYGFLMLVCVTFFAFLSPDNDVKAWDADLWLTIDGNYSDGTIPANGDWNSIQADKAQNNQHAIPSSVITNGTAVGFGVKNQGQYGSTWGYMTFYIKSPTSYTAQRITYNGSPYDIKYPCGFINYYPTDVEIPVGYTTCSETNSTRSVVYPNTSNGSLGTIDAAFICPTGNELLAICNYRVNQVVNPLETNDFSYQNYYFTDGYSNGILVMHPSDNNNNWGINNYWGMSNSPVPIFCDFYDALEYSCSGRILYPEHVLFGADSAVVTPTPTPTATPTPTPTTIPQITGSVSIDGDVTIGGGTISVDNFPTPEPTPTPIVPIVTDGPTPSPGGISSGNSIIDNSILGDIIPNISPGAYNFTEEESSALQEESSLLPHAYLQDIMDTNGSIFSRYPIAAIDRLTDKNQSQSSADDVSFFTYLAGTFYVFSDGQDAGGGMFGDFYFWFEAVIVSGILFIIVRKIIH